MMQFLECRGVGKTYASKAGPVEALRGIDLTAAEGEFVCLLGLSGCGKSTLLQLIAGLETPTAGAIWVDAPVVVDRHFVSSRKPDDLPDFCRGILEVMASR